MFTTFENFCPRDLSSFVLILFPWKFESKNKISKD